MLVFKILLPDTKQRTTSSGIFEAFNSVHFWEKLFENIPKKPPTREWQLISNFDNNKKLGKRRSFLKVGLCSEKDGAPTRTPNGPP
jgi:hypothetical protein